MSAWKRLVIATTVVLSGLLLLPFVALPSQAFSWQQFTNAYGSTPALGVNYTTGAPGSFFNFNGFNFPAGQLVTVRVNDRTIGAVTADANGAISFTLATPNADLGEYVVTATLSPGGLQQTTGQATVRFELRADAPVRSREGNAVVFVLSPGLISRTVFLPLIRR
jgi:hypothetical protein